jgi:hypothetical protein
MNYKCFECGTSECIQHHHIIPRSLGGTKTIPLCSICHGKAHGIKRNKQIDIGRLTKEGLMRAKARGVKLGNPRPKAAAAKGRATVQKKADTFALKMEPIILPMLNAGMSQKAIAEALNTGEIKTIRNGSWTNTSIRRLVLRLEKMEDK